MRNYSIVFDLCRFPIQLFNSIITYSFKKDMIFIIGVDRVMLWGVLNFSSCQNDF